MTSWQATSRAGGFLAHLEAATIATEAREDEAKADAATLVELAGIFMRADSPPLLRRMAFVVATIGQAERLRIVRNMIDAGDLDLNTLIDPNEKGTDS